MINAASVVDSEEDKEVAVRAGPCFSNMFYWETVNQSKPRKQRSDLITQPHACFSIGSSHRDLEPALH